MPQVSQHKNRIENIFDHLLCKSDSLSGIGLYSGAFGRLLFLAHYLQYHPEENNGCFDRYAEQCFDAICSKPAIHTYCNGMAGVLECLRHLTRSGRLEVDYSEVEEQYKPHLLQCLQRDFARDGDYDLLHGAMGVAYHFREDETFAAETARWLHRTAICDGDRLKWQSTLSPVEKGIRGYNICLSHWSFARSHDTILRIRKLRNCSEEPFAISLLRSTMIPKCAGVISRVHRRSRNRSDRRAVWHGVTAIWAWRSLCGTRGRCWATKR